MDGRKVVAATALLLALGAPAAHAAPGVTVYPETGNGGYLSLHTDVYNVYDAVANLFLPGNHVDLTQRATQCLTDFSLDFERSNTNATAGPNMTVGAVKINDATVVQADLMASNGVIHAIDTLLVPAPPVDEE